MLVIIILLIFKTFFFLRIIESYTPIVIMLVNVMYDLRVFLLFYFILLLMYSLLFGVIGVGLDSVQPKDGNMDELYTKVVTTAASTAAKNITLSTNSTISVSTPAAAAAASGITAAGNSAIAGDSRLLQSTVKLRG